jgi:hypothetical protein
MRITFNYFVSSFPQNTKKCGAEDLTTPFLAAVLQQHWLNSVMSFGYFFLCGWIAVLAIGCNGSPEIKPISSAATEQTNIISGPTQLRAGQTAAFTYSTTNQSQVSGTWYVNGIAGGNTDVGIISEAGIYSAPSSAPTDSISVSYLPSNSAQPSPITLSILNPIPVISSASIIGSVGENYVVEFMGNGFLLQSVVNISGTSVPTTYLSSTELRATIMVSSISGDTAIGTVTNPSPGPSTSNTINITLPPTPLKQIIGCTNPNSGTSNGDWGTSSSPVYTSLTYDTQLIGTPSYTTNSIYWISRETKPGQSILMTGAFTSASKTAKIVLIPSGIIDWQAIVNENATAQSEVNATQQGTTGLSVTVPMQLSPGVYGIKIEDTTTQPIYALANQPSITWAIGVPSESNFNTAFQSQVHDCGVEPGEVLRIFGKNFVPSSNVILESSNGTTVEITPFKVDSNSLAVSIPTSVSTGTYNVWVGNYPWDATSSPASVITILSPQSITPSYVTCTSLIGDGVTDNAAILQSCLDSNAPTIASNQLVYISIPDGVFALKSAVIFHPYEFIVGLSPNSSRFVGLTAGSQPHAWFVVSQYTGMANLSVTAAGAACLFAYSDATGNPATSGHVFLSNMVFDSTSSGLNSSGTMVSLSGPDIQVYGSTFQSGTNGNLGVYFGDGAEISGNTFINSYGLNVFSASQNIIAENNTIYSEIGPGADGTTAFDIARPFCAYCSSMLSQNLYIGYNTIHDMGASNNQLIATDGGGGAYYGPVTSSTADTVVLSGEPSWEWVGTSNPQTLSIAIVLGTGVGQFSTLSSYRGDTVTLTTPWAVTPDSTSIVVIVSAQLNLTIANNSFTNTLGMSVYLNNSIDAVIEDNVLTNSGQGIQLWAYGPYGGPAAFGPIMNTDVLRNTINVGNGDLLISAPNENVAGVGIFDGYGCMVSGMMMRGNVVPAIQTLYNTNGSNGINANVIEDNIGNWKGPSISGFLVQNNIAP